MASGTVGFTQSNEETEEVRRHLDEVIRGVAFRGSQRSQQFLRYVVEKALTGEISCLKERTIGVELFQRSPTYDTGQDAIVRVTASDVRRRLLEHYVREEDSSPLHIQLPRGSYVPEFEAQQMVGNAATALDVIEAPEPPSIGERELAHEVASARPRGGWWAGVAVGVLASIVIVLSWQTWRHSISQKPAAALPPWSVILKPGRQTQIITSDPNVEELQQLLGRSISLSDYANRRFIPDAVTPTRDEQQFFRFYQHADHAAAVDTPLAVSIARLAPPDLPIQIRSARSLHITDLQNDDNVILIGSPRSNPWVELFQDQLDFRFVFHPELNQEIVENLYPRGHEQERYQPTARGFATGDSFALVALVQNANRSGRVLILAGASAEGTEAAGHVVTDREHLARLLQYCGIVASGGAVQDFELLLQLRTLAGSPSATNMVACHVYPGHK